MHLWIGSLEGCYTRLLNEWMNNSLEKKLNRFGEISFIGWDATVDFNTSGFGLRIAYTCIIHVESEQMISSLSKIQQQPTNHSFHKFKPFSVFKTLWYSNQFIRGFLIIFKCFKKLHLYIFHMLAESLLELILYFVYTGNILAWTLTRIKKKI